MLFYPSAFPSTVWAATISSPASLSGSEPRPGPRTSFWFANSLTVSFLFGDQYLVKIFVILIFAFLAQSLLWKQVLFLFFTSWIWIRIRILQGSGSESVSSRDLDPNPHPPGIWIRIRILQADLDQNHLSP